MLHKRADNLVEAELREVKSHGIANLDDKVFNNNPDIKIISGGVSTLAIGGDFEVQQTYGSKRN